MSQLVDMRKKFVALFLDFGVVKFPRSGDAPAADAEAANYEGSNP